jgi:tetratricopeptide (TPR) repeat protein
MFPTNNGIIRQAMESGDPTAAARAIREIDSLLPALAGSNERASLLLNKAVFYGILGRFSNAREQLEAAFKGAPDDDAIRLQFEYLQGAIDHQEQHFEDAYSRMTATLSKYSARLAEPGFRFLYLDIQQHRAFELVQLLKFREAVPLLRESLSFDMKAEDRRAAVANLGICYSRLGKYEEAVDCFLAALGTGLTSDWEGQVHCQLGIAYAHLNLLRDAKKELQICEERASQYQLPMGSVYGWLSRVCRGLGERSESERYARLSRPF